MHSQVPICSKMSQLCILASFAKDKVPVGAWIYLWVFYLIPLVYISVLCQYHTVSMTTVLYYSMKSGRMIPPAPFFFLKMALAIQGLLCFHMNCEIFSSSSVKNAIGKLIRIALNPQTAFDSILIFDTIDSSNPGTRNYSPSVYVLFLSSKEARTYNGEKTVSSISGAAILNSYI